jgi:hypothetical protein
VPKSIYLKKNIDPAHFSLFFQNKIMAEHFPRNSTKKMLHMHCFQDFQFMYIKNDAITICYCLAHEQPSANVERSNLLAE